MFRKKSVIEPQLNPLDPQESLKYETKNLRKKANVIGFGLNLDILIMGIMFSITLSILHATGKYNPLDSGNGFDGYDPKAYYLLLIISSILTLTIPILFMFSFIRKKSSNKLFPFKKINLKSGIAFYLMGMLACFISQILSALINVHFNLSNPEISLDLTPSGIILMFIYIAVIPAILEELMFRGVILSSFRAYGSTLAIVVSSVLFSFIHANFAQIPFALIVGLTLGFIAIKTDSLWINILVHFTNNLFSSIILILNEKSGEGLANTMILIFYSVIFVLGTISIIYLLRTQKPLFKIKDDKKLLPLKESLKAILLSPTIIIFMIVAVVFAIY